MRDRVRRGTTSERASSPSEEAAHRRYRDEPRFDSERRACRDTSCSFQADRLAPVFNCSVVPAWSFGSRPRRSATAWIAVLKSRVASSSVRAASSLRRRSSSRKGSALSCWSTAPIHRTGMTWAASCRTRGLRDQARRAPSARRLRPYSPPNRSRHATGSASSSARPVESTGDRLASFAGPNVPEESSRTALLAPRCAVPSVTRA